MTGKFNLYFSEIKLINSNGSGSCSKIKLKLNETHSSQVKCKLTKLIFGNVTFFFFRFVLNMHSITSSDY